MQRFVKVTYPDLNAKQQEVYNFHHIAALLARYGFATYPIRDDWSGVDMFARHMVSGQPLTIQIKGRMTFAKKYVGKDLWIGFPDRDSAYVFRHDELLDTYLTARQARGVPLTDNKAWSEGGLVSWSTPTAELLELLRPFRLDP